MKKIIKYDINTKTLIIFSLILISIIVTYLFKILIKIDVVFTQFYYVPISLSAFWWKKKGIIVPFFLSLFLFTFNIFFNLSSSIPNDLFRSSMFIFVSLFIILTSSRLERNIKSLDKNYYELVENVNSIIAKFDHDGKIISMNKYGLDFFGYSLSELIGKRWDETIVPKYDSTGRKLENLASEILKDLDKYGININENIKKNGERVWIHWTNKPIFDDTQGIDRL